MVVLADLAPEEVEDNRPQSIQEGQERRLDDLREEVVRRARVLHSLYVAGSPSERAALQVEDRRRCVEDFEYWVRQWGWCLSPKASDFRLRDTPMLTWGSQARLVQRILELLREAVETGRTLLLLVPKSREIGVTWILLLVIYWLWNFHQSDSLVGSKSGDAVDSQGDSASLFERLRYIHSKQPPHLRHRHRPPRVKERVLSDPESGASITGAMTTADFGRGGRYLLAFCDEFATVDQRIAEGMIGALNTAASLIVLVYNPPRSNTHKAAKLFRSLPERQVLAMDWRSDPYRPVDFLKWQEIAHGGIFTRDEIRREFCCEHGVATEGTVWALQEPMLSFDDRSEDWLAVRTEALAAWMHIGAWDFGSGPSFLVCLLSLVQVLPGLPVRLRLWVLREFVYQRASYRTAASDVLEAMEDFKGQRFHVGDPAGIAADAELLSWEARLQGQGVPLKCLPGGFGTWEAKDSGILVIQSLGEAGLLRVHRTGCPRLLNAIAGWSWNTPPGVAPADVEAVRLSPRKDAHSHLAEPLIYLGHAAAHVRVQIERDKEAAEDARRASQGLDSYSGRGSVANVKALLGQFRSSL